MKTKLRFYALSIAVAFILGVSLNSCTKEQSALSPTSPNQENLQLKSATAPSTDVVCDLVAGQTIPAGQVIISNDGVDIHVEYLTTGGWTLSEVHLYIGTIEGVPQNKQGVPVPGHFPYFATNLGGLTQYSFDVPIASLGDQPVGGYAVFAHAVVMNGNQQETAWSSGCNSAPIITLKSHLTEEGKISWAATDGEHFSSDWYCSSLGVNVYHKGDQYILQQVGAYPASEGGAGVVDVTDDGTNLTVTVTPNAGIVLTASYLFIGSWEELLAIYKPVGTCPQYGDFPFKNPNTVGTTHVFVIPLADLPPINGVTVESFQSGLGINRWGWYFYYEL